MCYDGFSRIACIDREEHMHDNYRHSTVELPRMTFVSVRYSDADVRYSCDVLLAKMKPGRLSRLVSGLHSDFR